jgi:NADPH:quinone reductase-like Zn-dependent oxidoreductase
VFAANVLQTTYDVIHSLDSLRRLLVPGGLLILLELTLTHAYFDLLFGIFPQWWRDEHTRGPLTLDKWAQALQSAGGFDLPMVTSKQSPFGDTLIISRKTTSRSTLLQLPEWQDQAWLLLANPTQNTQHLLQTLRSHLPSSNIMLLENTINIDDTCLKIKTMLSQCRQLHIIFASPLDLIQLGQNNDEAALKKQEEICIAFVRILQTIQKHHEMDRPVPYVFVVTQNSQVTGGDQTFDLGAVPLIGLARSLNIEYASRHIKLIDLQPTMNMLLDSSLAHIFIQHLINCRTADDLDEVVLRHDGNGRMQCFRWHYDLLQSKQHDKLTTTTDNEIIPRKNADTSPFRLQVAPSRFVADLSWTREFLSTNTLLPDQILVRVHCVGLNSRDALKARGLYPHTREFAQEDKDQPLHDQDGGFGTDFMGTIVRSQSDRFNIGDRVVGSPLFGAFHSHVVIDARSVLRVSQECLMSDEQLAAFPTAFLTAIFSLKYRIRLKRDHFVLIHAATGATAQACIQYCQAVGARVIATAGSDEKRRFLKEHYDIEHVFNSRDLSFVNEVRSLVPTGVNVVVNSLSGPLLQESIKLLAPHGHFVELGKRDVYNKSSLSMFDLREDCNFHVIDLVLHGRDESNSIQEMMEDIMGYYQKGVFKPIQPLTIFDPSEVVDAFTQCTLGQSMGKIIVNITNSEKPLLIKTNNSNRQSSENKQEEGMFVKTNEQPLI